MLKRGKLFLLGFLLTVQSLHVFGQKLSNRDEVAAYSNQRTGIALEYFQKGEIKTATMILDSLCMIPEIQNEKDIYASCAYNTACGYSLQNQKEKALNFLRISVENGNTNDAHMNRDTDLDNIRNEKAFTEILNLVKLKKQFWNNDIWKSGYTENLTSELKLAGLSKFWSEVKYNFAYFDHIPFLNWDSLYIAYIPKVLATQSTFEYYLVLQQMCSMLKDGHTNVSFPNAVYSKMGRVGLRTDLIENKIIITAVSDSLNKAGIKIGAEITLINGIAAKKYSEQSVMPYQSASTPQDLTQRMYNYSLLTGKLDEPLNLTIQNPGSKITMVVNLKRTPFSKPLFPAAKPFEFRKIDNVAHIIINTFNNEIPAQQFDSLFNDIQACDALVIDLRNNGGGNSSVGYKIISQLTKNEVQTSVWKSRRYVPTYRAWGRPEGWEKGEMATIAPNRNKYFSKPIAVLTSARTYSAAEDFCVALRESKRGLIIGEATGGSTGQPLFFDLPGGGNARVCTKRDTFPNGTEFVGFGIQPDLVVSPTIASISNGEDLVLSAAIKKLSEAKK